MKGRLARARIALVVLTAVLTSIVRADERDFVGVVTKVFDGDSFIVLPERGHDRRDDVEVRLLDIDAPEKDQPHADTARGALIKLIEGRRIFVDVIDIDRYERKVAKVYREPDRLDITRALIRDGHVWVNRKFTQDLSLAELEDVARSKHQGLWALPDQERVPPWQFRRENRQHLVRKRHESSAER